MNKLIKEQLAKLSVADISKYDADKKEFNIPRITKIKLEENSYYIIKLDDTLLNPNDAATLSANWNQGTIPPCKYLKVDVSKILGKMIKVNGIGYDHGNNKDLDAMWSGWLPIAQIEVISKL